MLRGASEVDLLFNHTTTLILGSPSHPLITPSITEGQLQGSCRAVAGQLQGSCRAVAGQLQGSCRAVAGAR